MAYRIERSWKKELDASGTMVVELGVPVVWNGDSVIVTIMVEPPISKHDDGALHEYASKAIRRLAGALAAGEEP